MSDMIAKPLVWKAHDAPMPPGRNASKMIATAEVLGMTYSIHEHAEGVQRFCLLRGMRGCLISDYNKDFHQTEAVAKAAAQANIERLLASLFASPQPPTPAGVREITDEMVELFIRTSSTAGGDVNACVRAGLSAALAAAGKAEMTDAVRDVLAERQRQVEAEGWTPEHDDAHDKGELSAAAGVYALAAASRDYRWVLRGSPVNDYLAAVFKLWPFEWSWFKPKSRRQDKVRAAALLLADIEREDRALASTPAATGGEKV